MKKIIVLAALTLGLVTQAKADIPQEIVGYTQTESGISFQIRSSGDLRYSKRSSNLYLQVVGESEDGTVQIQLMSRAQDPKAPRFNSEVGFTVKELRALGLQSGDRFEIVNPRAKLIMD